MIQHMQTWLNSHGDKQHDIIQRLRKDSVRNHRNVRAAGDDSGPAYVGGAGHDAGIQAQASLQGYLHNLPGVQQSNSLMSTFGLGSRSDERREATTTSYSVGDGHYHNVQSSGNYASPLVTSGEASKFYVSGSGPPGDGASSFQSTEYISHSHHHHSSSQEHVHHNAPSFPGAPPPPTPSFPSESVGYSGAPEPYSCGPHSGPGYIPSYAPPQGPPPPTFPTVHTYNEQQTPNYAPPQGPPPPAFPVGRTYDEQSQYPSPSGYPSNQDSYGGGLPRGGGW